MVEPKVSSSIIVISYEEEKDKAQTTWEFPHAFSHYSTKEWKEEAVQCKLVKLPKLEKEFQPIRSGSIAMYAGCPLMQVSQNPGTRAHTCTIH